MGVRERLERGLLGVSLELPPSARVVEESREQFELIDEATGVHWWVMLFPEFTMDLGEAHRDHLLRSLEWPARAMFEDLHTRSVGPEERPPRTADADWTPVIDAEFARCGEADVLRTAHRMLYVPGSEVIMGHVLAQLPAAGLFEVRVLARNQGPTGMRESMLMLKDPTALPTSAGEPVAMPKQSVYDDPAHDAAFPDHPLSRVREAQRWTLEHMRVHEPAAPPSSSARIRDANLGCSFLPPPRFMDGLHGVHRVSFCGTDGIQWLFVDRLRSTSDLEAAARKHARSKHREPGVRRVELDVHRASVAGGRDVVFVRVRAEARESVAENAFAYFDLSGSRWAIGLTNTRSVPPAEVRDELSRVAAAFEADERPTRRWWPFG